MTIETWFFAGSGHGLFGEIASPPALRRIDIDVLWPAKTVHRIVHLHAFPAMIIVILVKDEIETGPTRREKCVVTLLMRHVHQLIDLAPVVPLKTAVELRIAFQRRILVNKGAVVNA